MTNELKIDLTLFAAAFIAIAAALGANDTSLAEMMALFGTAR